MSILKKHSRIKTDTIADKLYGDGSKLILEINNMVTMRKKWRMTQEYVAQQLGVSISTIKRFESLKVDSLSIFFNYKQIFY